MKLSKRERMSYALLLFGLAVIAAVFWGPDISDKELEVVKSVALYVASAAVAYVLGDSYRTSGSALSAGNEAHRPTG